MGSNGFLKVRRTESPDLVGSMGHFSVYASGFD